MRMTEDELNHLASVAREQKDPVVVLLCSLVSYTQKNNDLLEKINAQQKTYLDLFSNGIIFVDNYEESTEESSVSS